MQQLRPGQVPGRRRQDCVQDVHRGRLLPWRFNDRKAVRVRLFQQRDGADVASWLQHVPRRPCVPTRFDRADALRRRQRDTKHGRGGVHFLHYRLLPG